MRYPVIWLLAGLLVAACGSEVEKEGPAKPVEDPGLIPELEGNDNLQPLGTLGVTEGSLYNDVAVSEGYIYACTGAEGLAVAAIGDGFTLEFVNEKLEFTDGKGCRTVTVAPDGAIFATGQAAAGGSFISSIAAGGGSVGGSVVDAGILIESIAATNTHVFAFLGEGGLKVYGRNDGQLAEVGALPSGFDQALGGAVWCHDKDAEDPEDMGTCDRLVVANGLGGEGGNKRILVLDISDPTSPTIDASFKAYGTARRVVVSGDYAYVAQVAGGISVFDLTSDAPFPPMSSWSTHASSVELALTEDGRIFVANMEDLCVLDATTPNDISFVASEYINTPNGGTPRVVSVRAATGVAVAAEWSGLWTYAYADGKVAADIHLAKTKLNLGLVYPPDYKGKGILLRNMGNEPLEISDLKIVDESGESHPAFTIEVDKNTLQVGAKALLEIRFTPVDDQPVEVWAQLATNDPDEANVRIPVTANQIDGYQVGAKFDPNGELNYSEYKTGNIVTYKSEYAGKVVVMAYFASW